MILLGEYNTLQVLRRAEQGLYLGGENDEGILLPNKYVPEGTKVGDTLRVFVYNDSEDRIIATTLTPNLTLNKFACLDVISVTRNGAFLNWGLAKDLFVPFDEQSRKMERGESYIVVLYLDTVSNRLVASSKINKFLKKEAVDLVPKQEVELLIADRTDIGVNVIINQKYKGILYLNEIFQDLHYGDVKKGYIKKVREDKKIDVTLQPWGYKTIVSHEDKILQKLKEHGGELPLNDYSSPEEIGYILEMSKKTFKKAIGALFKKRLIQIEEKGISLLNK